MFWIEINNTYGALLVTLGPFEGSYSELRELFQNKGWDIYRVQSNEPFRDQFLKRPNGEIEFIATVRSSHSWRPISELP